MNSIALVSAAALTPALTPALLFPAPSLAGVSDVEAKIKLVLSRLPHGAPFITPAMLGPVLGIGANGVCKHCRGYSKLKTWKSGNYRFYTDDRGHMDILVGLIRLILFSGLKLPSELQTKARNSQATRVH